MQKSPSTNAGKTKKTGSFNLINQLYTGKDAKVIKDFYNDFEGLNVEKAVTVFVYCLKRKIGLEKVTTNHLYTCYKIVGKPVPKAFPQEVRNAKSKNAWLDHDNWDDLKITHLGENAVEYEFSKKAAA